MAPTRPVRTYSRRQSFKDSPASSSSKVDKRRNVEEDEVEYDQAEVEVERDTKRRAIDGLSWRNDSKASSASVLRKSPSLEDTTYNHPVNLKGKNKAENEQSLARVPTLAFERETTPVASSSNSTSNFPTPSKNPKDLSHLFEAVTPQRKNRLQKAQPAGTPSSTGKGLSRSKTESSLDASPSRASHTQATPRTQSLVERPQKPLSRDISPSPIKRNRRTPHTEAEIQNASTSQSTIQRHSQTQAQTQVQNHPLQDNGTNKRTYAGRSRSFLVALPTTSIAARNLMNGMKEEQQIEDDDDDYTRDSYAELRRRYGVDNSEGDLHIDEDNPNSTTISEGLSLYNNLSSITDLRSKGESRRFLDEIGYLFEGLEPSGALSVRRSSACDILCKLCNEEYWRRARAAGLLVEIWDQLRAAEAGNGDKILDTVLCCFVSLASVEPRDVSLLTAREDFVQTIINMLEAQSENDSFTNTTGQHTFKAQYSKIEIQLINRLREAITQNKSITRGNTPPSTRLLISNTLATIPSSSFPHIKILLNSVSNDFTSIQSRLKAFRSGLPLLPEPAPGPLIDPIDNHEKLSLEHVYNILGIIDLYLLELDGSGGSDEDETEDEDRDKTLLSKSGLLAAYETLPSQLVALILFNDVLNRGDGGREGEGDQGENLRARGSQCADLAFRILINLSNGNDQWSKAITLEEYTLPTLMRIIVSVYPSAVGTSDSKNQLSPNAKNRNWDDRQRDKLGEGDKQRAMDRLCLALALLTNLIQEVKHFAVTLQEYKISTNCKGAKTCLTSCHCQDSVSSCEIFVDMYGSLLLKNEDDEMSPDLHFLRGHLAVFLGLLILRLQAPSSHSHSSASSIPTTNTLTHTHSPANLKASALALVDILPSGPNSNSNSGSGSTQNKLDALIDNVEIFSGLYATLTGWARRMSTSSGSVTAVNGLEHHDIGSDTGEHDGRATTDPGALDVVLSVIDSLRALRRGV